MSEKVVFGDMPVSEQIAVLSTRYHREQTAAGRERIGCEYGMSMRNVARYIRCDRLIHEFKDMLDDRSLSMSAAGEISFLSEKEQRIVLGVMEQSGVRLDRDTAVRLRKNAGSISEAEAQAVFGVDKPVEASDIKGTVKVVLPAKVYRQYFADVAVKDVQGILQAALEQYYQREGA